VLRRGLGWLGAESRLSCATALRIHERLRDYLRELTTPRAEALARAEAVKSGRCSLRVRVRGWGIALAGGDAQG
jgi:hypothetical protein